MFKVIREWLRLYYKEKIKMWRIALKEFVKTVMPNYEKTFDDITKLTYHYLPERIDTLPSSLIERMGSLLDYMNNNNLPDKIKRQCTDMLITELRLSMSLNRWFRKKLVAYINYHLYSQG